MALEQLSIVLGIRLGKFFLYLLIFFVDLMLSMIRQETPSFEAILGQKPSDSQN